MTDQDTAEIIPYLTKLFGTESEFARSPADAMFLDMRKSSRRDSANEASKIVYVDYELPGWDHIPWEATPNPYRERNVWFAEAWTANGIGKSSIRKTGETTDYKVPTVPGLRALHVHSVVEGPDGTDMVCRVEAVSTE